MSDEPDEMSEGEAWEWWRTQVAPRAAEVAKSMQRMNEAMHQVHAAALPLLPPLWTAADDASIHLLLADAPPP